MNTKSKFALALVLFSAAASPALAGDQDLATLLATSGRYLPEQTSSMPALTYASAGYGEHRAAPMSHWTAESRWSGERHSWSGENAIVDFQAQGHN